MKVVSAAPLLPRFLVPNCTPLTALRTTSLMLIRDPGLGGVGLEIAARDLFEGEKTVGLAP